MNELVPVTLFYHHNFCAKCFGWLVRQTSESRARRVRHSLPLVQDGTIQITVLHIKAHRMLFLPTDPNQLDYSTVIGPTRMAAAKRTSL